MENRQRGFVNPEYLILIALMGIGAALVIPVAWSLIQSDPVSTWDWVGLGTGVLIIGGCVGWWVRWNT
jgi:hypothetical protein